MMIGRSKEMFKSGGYNVYPVEVENAIATHSKVDMVAVVAVPDELFQEVGHAFITPVVGANLTVDEIRAHCRSLLANYKIPKQFFIWDDLPRTPVGKIDKPALWKVAVQGPAN
jgi:fatty-acyl-CoA synthase